MAGVKKKLKTVMIKMVSQANTGFMYLMRKNPTKTPRKMTVRKYDPIVNEHVIFLETKRK